jgi:glutamine amidotransferase
MSTVTIVDYGMGNVGSVANAFRSLGVDCLVTSAPTAIRDAKVVVLPGVGAFRAAMENLRAAKLDDALTETVVERKTPFLGICLGMQLLAFDSVEHGFSKGLGWIPGHVVRMAPDSSVPVPQVGWNTLRRGAASPLFARIADGAHFYFDHSYCLTVSSDVVTATCEYGGSWIAAVQRDNIHAVQFHPEKSQRSGLRLLRNFLRLTSSQ